MTPSLPLVPGDLLADRYQVEALLGEGGMGRVFRATDVRLGRAVAVKVLQPEIANRASARLRFEREARVASLLRHPNAVVVHDFGESGGLLYIAMDLVPGICLRELVDDDLPPLPTPRAIAITRQIADVLVAAEALKLVHRDLKPENVFLEERGGRDHVVVGDFGLAFVGESEALGRLTRDGVPTGTPAYLAPEQARGAEVGPPADVYALGCVLFELLTARPPFLGPPADMMAAHLFRQPPALHEVGAHVPGALAELVARMLDKDPQARPSARAVCDTFDALDADAPLRMGRGRQAPELSGRAGRMISLAETRPLGSSPAPERDGVAAVWGVIGDDTVTALGAVGLGVRSVVAAEEATGADVVLAFGRSLEELGLLVATGVPVVADAEVADVERFAALLRVGVVDVVTPPFEPSRIAAKARRSRRKTGSGTP